MHWEKKMQTAFKYSDNNCLDIPIYVYYNCVLIMLKLNYDGYYPYVLQKSIRSLILIHEEKKKITSHTTLTHPPLCICTSYYKTILFIQGNRDLCNRKLITFFFYCTFGTNNIKWPLPKQKGRQFLSNGFCKSIKTETFLHTGALWFIHYRSILMP